ncbi:Aste57867_18797 [Aphanomyces stellatus]|uniref:Aste57867_18797 protein n=1 Tax=Aphanomyces stellatus TaxID=120398 RepID=A0A485LCR2_9STRA|nr:hypothetical protein As57867_018733 [Aphanomyces stellatus]VFT95531.1 Aste57867_18797 [Aphanomyces stellatus]
MGNRAPAKDITYTDIGDKKIQAGASSTGGRVQVSGGRPSISNAPPPAAPTKSKRTLVPPRETAGQDHMDKAAAPPPTKETEDQLLRRYSSVSSTSRLRPDQPYDKPITYTLAEVDFKRIQQTIEAADDDGDDDLVHELEEVHETPSVDTDDQSTANNNRTTQSAGKYLLQHKRTSVSGTIVKPPISGLVGLQPGFLVVDTHDDTLLVPGRPTPDDHRFSATSSTTAGLPKAKYR